MAEMGKVHVAIKKNNSCQYCVVAKEKVPEVATESFGNYN